MGSGETMRSENPSSDDALDHNYESISRNIRYQILSHGFRWVFAAVVILYLIVSYYLLVDTRSASQNDFPSLFSGLLALLLGFVGFRVGNKSRYQKFFWSIAALSISLSLVLLAYLTESTWLATSGAKKILLISFMVMLMSWNISRLIVTAGLLPVVTCYFYLSWREPNYLAIDILLSMIKFPLLVVMFYSTIRRFIISIEKRFITKIKTIDRLERNSYLDELTRIKNRRGFNADLEKAVGAATRFKTGLSVVIIDIDFFKQYNDTLGHPAGDFCLKKVAAILSSACKRSVDTVARIGGEEFALIMPGTKAESAEYVTGNIRETLKRSALVHPGSSISEFVTASIGIAEYDTGDDFHSLYQRADRAMYKAKVAGRDRCIICHKDCDICQKNCDICS